ncbi:methyltransferase domain-containing protein [Mesorhizobium sp. LMG 17147]|uniref:class I SAM-dependent methyltransferase n=1 Tax=Mesorhizobium sp. LMG 17147 TaxID=2963091 RepID=UPI0020C94E39|nr:class I SAM-dependent methyltransferase [Mesorhizobium sp. LMG 17147]MCP9232442.1 methyltransferase domain-containing protein [Mesorhizobium sp. LMG 17147]
MVLNCAEFYDAELRRHNEVFRAAVKVGTRDRVLDIGCGSGQSSRDAARVAVEGSVLGVDVSAQMLEIARSRSAEEGLRNVAFERGDAQLLVFPPAGFDLCISRFGVMFFADPAAAFANIGRAMRPGARLVWMVWQGQDRNEWATAIQRAIAPGTAISAGAATPFSLGDPAITAEILRASGFVSVDFAEVREPVFYGQDVDAAYDALLGLQLVKDPLARADVDVDAALRRLRDLLDAHLTADGVLFDSRAWIITAVRASRQSPGD